MTEVMGFHRGGFGPRPNERHGYWFHGRFAGARTTPFASPATPNTGWSRLGTPHTRFPFPVDSDASVCGAGTDARPRVRGRLTVGPSSPTLVADEDCTMQHAPTPTKAWGFAVKPCATHDMVDRFPSDALPPTAEAVGFRAVIL